MIILYPHINYYNQNNDYQTHRSTRVYTDSKDKIFARVRTDRYWAVHFGPLNKKLLLENFGEVPTQLYFRLVQYTDGTLKIVATSKDGNNWVQGNPITAYDESYSERWV